MIFHKFSKSEGQTKMLTFHALFFAVGIFTCYHKFPLPLSMSFIFPFPDPLSLEAFPSPLAALSLYSFFLAKFLPTYFLLFTLDEI